MIQIKKELYGFTLSVNGLVLIEHKKQQPFLCLGKGTGKFQVRHGNYTIKNRPHGKMACFEWEIREESETKVTLTARDLLRIVFEEEKMQGPPKGTQLQIRFERLNGEFNRMWLDLSAAEQEHIYGCGEQFSRLDLRGSLVPLWVQEQGVGRGKGLITVLSNLHSGAGGHWYSTYFPRPGFVSTRNYFCDIDTTAYAEFDFRKSRSHTLHVWEIPEKITFGFYATALHTLSAQNTYLGIQPELPAWARDGIWLGVQGGTGEVGKKLEDALNSGVKVAALWAQDWEGKRITSFGKQLMWNWVYDPELYPDLPSYISSLRERGIRFLGYINPFLALEGSLYKEASKRGYCVKNSAGEDYSVVVTTFPAAMLDLTNPKAFKWIKEIIKKNMIDIGLSGWMADFGEYLPTDAVLHSGESAETFHNRYPVEWARANREAVEEAGKTGEIVFFSRAGYSGSSRWSTAFWGGDQLVDWSTGDGLPTAVTAGISIGFSGVGFSHSDIGGYTSLGWIKRTPEVFMRWAEFAAFTPIMRSHEGNRPDTNHQFNSDEKTLKHLSRMTGIYTALKPYHLAVEQEYVSAGIPPVRHPFLHYPEDHALYDLKYQYLYGKDLMVAPVVKKRASRGRAYLPADSWIHLWSGKEYRDGWLSVDAPPGYPPVFYRKESGFAPLFAEIRERFRQPVF